MMKLPDWARTKVSLLIMVCVCLGFPRLCAADIAGDLEDFARRIKYLGADEVIYGFRENRMAPPENTQALREFEGFLKRNHYSIEQILPLLSHGDPKIRTLAMAALYDKEDPNVLPEIFKLIDDQEKTFPALLPVASAAIVNFKITELAEEQTVGKIATEIINSYLKTAGYYYGPKGVNDNPGFEDYWAKRKGRDYCAGWFAIRLARAGHSTSPTPSQRIPYIQKVRKDIDQIPEPDHTWILLWLSSEPGADVLAGEQELVQLLNSRGPESLIRLLQRNIPSQDPDLQARNSNNYLYSHMSFFILQHAKELLRPQDAQTLLDQEMKERDYPAQGISDPFISPWWSIAAAALNSPKEAAQILKEAYVRFQEDYGFSVDNRLALALAMWDQVGEDEVSTVVDWYYEQFNHQQLTTWAMSRFIEDAAQVKGRDMRILVKALVEDPRFEEMNLKSTEVLMKVVNTFVKAPIDGQEIHFPALDFFYSEKERSLKQYPKETEQMLNLLAQLRGRIRASVPLWDVQKQIK